MTDHGIIRKMHTALIDYLRAEVWVSSALLEEVLYQVSLVRHCGNDATYITVALGVAKVTLKPYACDIEACAAVRISGSVMGHLTRRTHERQRP